MAKRSRDITIAVVALAAAAAALYFAFGKRSQRVDLSTYEVLGAVTAEEAAKLLNNQGQILLLAPDTGANKNPSVEAELKAFLDHIKKQKGLSVATKRILINPMMMMATGGGLPPEEFFKAAESQPKPSAIVLFFGFPNLNDSDLDRLKKLNVKTVVVSSFHPGYKRLMESKALDLVIAPRLEPPPTAGSSPRTVKEKFDQEFEIFSAAGGGR